MKATSVGEVQNAAYRFGGSRVFGRERRRADEDRRTIISREVLRRGVALADLCAVDVRAGVVPDRDCRLRGTGDGARGGWWPGSYGRGDPDAGSGHVWVVRCCRIGAGAGELDAPVGDSAAAIFGRTRGLVGVAPPAEAADQPVHLAQPGFPGGPVSSCDGWLRRRGGDPWDRAQPAGVAGDLLDCRGKRRCWMAGGYASGGAGERRNRSGHDHPGAARGQPDRLGHGQAERSHAAVAGWAGRAGTSRAQSSGRRRRRCSGRAWPKRVTTTHWRGSVCSSSARGPGMSCSTS